MWTLLNPVREGEEKTLLFYPRKCYIFLAIMLKKKKTKGILHLTLELGVIWEHFCLGFHRI